AAVSGRGYGGNLLYGGTSSNTPVQGVNYDKNGIATWTFTGLQLGTYTIQTQWFADTNRATNAPFTISDGVTTTGPIQIDQSGSPAQSAWTTLSSSFTISSSTVTVKLYDGAAAGVLGAGIYHVNGYVVADAVRLVFQDTSGEIDVHDDTN